MASASMPWMLVQLLLPLLGAALSLSSGDHRRVSRLAATAEAAGPPRPVTLALRRVPRRPLPLRAVAAVQEDSLGPVRGVGVGLRERGHVYQGTVALGGEGQLLTVVFDTGSANLVVQSASCTARGCSGARHRFDPARSSTGGYLTAAGQRTDYDGAWRLSLGYASGKVAGEAFEDRVCLGGGGGACTSKARFLLAEYESDDFTDFGLDGVLGLAPQGKLSAGEGFSLMSQLVKQGALPERVFAVFLSGAEGASEITLGGYDPDRADGLSWLDADLRRGAWEVPLLDFQVNGRNQGLCADGACKAVLDSGCSAMSLPGGLAAELARRVNFTGSALQCGDPDAALPTLGLVLGGRAFALAPRDYVEVSPRDPDSCRLRWSDMAGAGLGEPTVLGHPFLLSFYSVFDEDRRRIGLARIPRPPAGGGAGDAGGAGGGAGSGAAEGPAAAAMRQLLLKARAGL